MPRETHEPTRVYWLAALPAPAAPTVAQINAATELTDQMPVDGINFNNTRNNASQAMLGDAFVAEKPGTWGTQPTLTFLRDDDTDAAWALFADRPSGFLVISRFGPANVAGTDVEVYPVQAHKPAPLASAENEYQKFEVQFGTTSEPELEAVVAA